MSFVEDAQLLKVRDNVFRELPWHCTTATLFARAAVRDELAQQARKAGRDSEYRALRDDAQALRDRAVNAQ